MDEVSLNNNNKEKKEKGRDGEGGRKEGRNEERKKINSKHGGKKIMKAEL